MTTDSYNHPWRLRRRLPSGRIVEVALPPAFRGATALTCCPGCSFVDIQQVTAHRDSGTQRWWLTLRCPRCELRWDGAFADHQMERFAAVKDERTARGEGQAAPRQEARMATWISRFCEALHHGHIEPADF